MPINAYYKQISPPIAMCATKSVEYMQAKPALLTSAIQLSLTVTMLTRSIIFAHLLSPDDYGLAMTFGVVLLFCEHISNFGHELFTLRSKNGDKHSFQATLHTALLVRGVLVALSLVMLAPIIPTVLGLKSVNFNYALLAIIPLINSFTHLDFQRLNRQFDYSVIAKISISSDILSVTLAITLAFIWSNYWAFLISLIARHTVFVLLSHLFARRTYRLGFEASCFKELFHFGWPIILISGLRYLSMEADKIIIVRYFGLIDFTSYLLTMLVIRQSISLSVNAYSKIFVRRISQSLGHAEQLHAYKTNAIILLFISSPLLFALTTLSEPIIALLFGKQYQVIHFLAPAISGFMALRISGSWLNHIVLASDHTSKMLTCTALRLSGFGLALISAIQDLGVLAVVVSFALGEVIYIISMIFLLKDNRPELPMLTARITLFCLSNVLIATVVYWAAFSAGEPMKFAISSVYLFIMISLFLIKSSVCRNQLLKVVIEFRKIGLSKAQ